jgi:hypothetical protein
MTNRSPCPGGALHGHITQQAGSSVHGVAVRERTSNVGLQEDQVGSRHRALVVLATNDTLQALEVVLRPQFVTASLHRFPSSYWSCSLRVARRALMIRRRSSRSVWATKRIRWRAFGLRNLFSLYRPLTTTWRVYDNSADTPRLVASGAGARTMTVEAPEIWHRIRAEVAYEGRD